MFAQKCSVLWRVLWWTGNYPPRLRILVLFVLWLNSIWIMAHLQPSHFLVVKRGMWHRRTAEFVFLLWLIWKDKQPVEELSHSCTSKHIITMAFAVAVFPGLIEYRQAMQWNSSREPHRRHTLAAKNGPGGWLTPKRVAEAQERGWRDWCVYLKNYSLKATKSRLYQSYFVSSNQA